MKWWRIVSQGGRGRRILVRRRRSTVFRQSPAAAVTWQKVDDDKTTSRAKIRRINSPRLIQCRQRVRRSLSITRRDVRPVSSIWTQSSSAVSVAFVFILYCFLGGGVDDDNWSERAGNLSRPLGIEARIKYWTCKSKHSAGPTGRRRRLSKANKGDDDEGRKARR